MSQLVTKEALDQMVTLQKGYIDSKFAAAAPKFTLGYGLALSEAGELSVTLDTAISKVVTALPAAPAAGDENKIHLVLSAKSETGNTYTEYIWLVAEKKWEKIGEFKPEVDLTPYLKKADLTATVNNTSVEILKGTDQVAKFIIGDTLAGTVASKVFTFNLKEIIAAKAAGFYKVTVDKYGRVTEATAVAEADIVALGFSTTTSMANAISTAVEAEKNLREAAEKKLTEDLAAEVKTRTDNEATMAAAIKALQDIEAGRSLLSVADAEALYHTIYG